jgi:hypothetical protein
VAPRSIYSDLEPDSDDSSDHDLDKKPKALKPSLLKSANNISSLGRTGRPESSGNEWITSHHTSVQTDDQDNEFSDLDDDFIIREDWWSSKKQNVTLEYLKTISASFVGCRL